MGTCRFSRTESKTKSSIQPVYEESEEEDRPKKLGQNRYRFANHVHSFKFMNHSAEEPQIKKYFGKEVKLNRKFILNHQLRNNLRERVDSYLDQAGHESSDSEQRTSADQIVKQDKQLEEKQVPLDKPETEFTKIFREKSYGSLQIETGNITARRLLENLRSVTSKFKSK